MRGVRRYYASTLAPMVERPVPRDQAGPSSAQEALARKPKHRDNIIFFVSFIPKILNMIFIKPLYENIFFDLSSPVSFNTIHFDFFE
jgi:hypothetical protein